MGDIVVGDRKFSLDAKVVRSPVFEFRNLRKRPELPQLGVLHWYGEDGVQEAHERLCNDGLSVDFLIDCAGTIVQCNPDPTKFYCQHARGVNQRSWGIEILNPTWPKVAGTDSAYRDMINIPKPHGEGHVIEVYEFTRPQVESAVKLCLVMVQALDIPARLPRIDETVSLGTAWENRQAGKLEQIKNTFTGICGHYHTTTRRLDPGTQLWPPLTAAGFR